MTIKFHCPTCGAIIGFADQHRGKRAHCTTCGQHFIIPSENNATPEKVKPPEEKSDPIPGFYRAALVDSWKLFLKIGNITGFVFIIAAVTFKFFTGHTDYSWTMNGFRFQAPTGLIITLTTWGCLFWYYMEIIHLAAINIDELPDVDMGDLFGFIWNVIKSLFTFSFVLVVLLLPCILYIGFTQDQGVISHILSLIGLFAFPMGILTVSINGDMTMVFRADYIFKPIAKAFWPYLVVVAMFIIAWKLQLKTIEYGDLLGSDKCVVGFHLFVNLAVQMVVFIAMRSIGLFYRHFSCHFPWTEADHRISG